MEIMIMLLAMVSLLLLSTTTAYAHGYVESPPSRAFRYSNRRGTGSTAMIGNVATEPQSLGTRMNWPTGAGSPQDGRIASANCVIWTPQGCPQPIDRQTRDLWDKTTMSVGWNTFTWFYTASHRTQNWQFFITKPNWNPDAPLTRDQFDLTPIANEPGHGVSPGNNTRSTHEVFIPTDRNGYHVVYAVWNRSDSNEAFYQVIDLNIVGGTGPTTPEPEIPPTSFDNQRVNIATAVNGTSLLEPSGNHLVLWAPRHQNTQIWELSHQGNNVYTIKNVGDGRYLTETNNTLTVANTATAQARWRIVSAANNTYQLLNEATGRSLDVEGGNHTANGTNVITWSSTGNPNQRWYLNSAEELPQQPELPTVPGHLHTMGTLATGHVELMWAVVPNSIQTDIYRGDTEFSLTKIGNTPAPHNRFVDTTAQAGHTYFYHARAVLPSGESSAPSNTIQVQIPGNMVMPEPDHGAVLSPANLRVTDQTQTSISLAWDPVHGQVERYNIFRNGSKIADVASGTSTYTDYGLTPGTTYTYHVRTRAASDHSNVATGLTTSPVTITPQPTYPEWTATQSFLTGSRTIFNGNIYEARFNLFGAANSPGLRPDRWILIGPA